MECILALQQPADEDGEERGGEGGGGSARLTATGEMMSLQTQKNPQTSKVLRLVHAAVVAKNIKTVISFLSAHRADFPLRRLGREGAAGEKKKTKRVELVCVCVWGGTEEKTECGHSEKIHRASKV